MFPHLRIPLLRLRPNLSFIDYLPNCIVIIVFLGLGRERFLPLARYTHRSLLRIWPTLLPPLSPNNNTSRVPNHYGLQSSRITKPPHGTVPFDSSNSEVVWGYCCRILVIISYPTLFLPPPISPSLRLPPLAYVTLSSSHLRYYAYTPCTRRTSTSLLSKSLVPICPPGRERGSSSDTQRVKGELIGITTGLRH